MHGISDLEKYNQNDSMTFNRFDFKDIEMLAQTVNDYQLLKVYINETLFHETMDISLIDSPGLNIDTLKTTALFAKHEEIDILIFVLNAENHFTQSGKSFLEMACIEKSYIFIVVNKFDLIEKKERCKADIEAQLRVISSNTYHHREQLVHYVSAKYTDEDQESWNNLVKCLRMFVLEKRSHSKLSPAKRYLLHILSDISSLAHLNLATMKTKVTETRMEIDTGGQCYAKMLDFKTYLVDIIDELIEACILETENHVISQLDSFMDDIELLMEVTEWDGWLYAWTYQKKLCNLVSRLSNIRIIKCQVTRN